MRLVRFASEVACSFLADIRFIHLIIPVYLGTLYACLSIRQQAQQPRFLIAYIANHQPVRQSIHRESLVAFRTRQA